MGIVSVTELAQVSASRKFGEAPVFQRQFVVEVDTPTTTQSAVLVASGVPFLAPHPEATYCKALNASVSNYNSSRIRCSISSRFWLMSGSSSTPAFPKIATAAAARSAGVAKPAIADCIALNCSSGDMDCRA